jgi:predicted GIY-YIG superfamily endonuclease
MPAEARTERNPRSVIDTSGNTEAPVDWSQYRKYHYDPTAPHAVYWLTDVDGEAVYIGMSHHPEFRIAQHRKNGMWGSEIHSERIEWFENEKAAYAVEVAAIREAQPRHNKSHTKHYRPLLIRGR